MDSPLNSCESSYERIPPRYSRQGQVPLGKLMVTHKLLQGLEEMSVLAFGVGLTQVLIEYGRRRSGAAAACGVL